MNKVVAGRADWVGHQLHDHARVQFCVAKALLQRVESSGEGVVVEPRHKLDEWVAAAPIYMGQYSRGRTHCQGHQDSSKRVPIFLGETEALIKMVPIGTIPIPP